MGNRCDVLDARDADAESVQSAHGRFTAGAGAFNADFDVLQTEFESLLAGVFGGNLSREGRGLTRALEALSTGRGRRNGVALTVRDRDDRVVEGCMHVGDAFGHDLLHLLAGTNGLLRDGRARAVAGAADLLAALGLRTRQAAPAAAKQPAPLSATARRVLAGIGPKPVGIEELCVSTGLPMSALLGTLMKLELTGRVYKQPGQRYVLR